MKTLKRVNSARATGSSPVAPPAVPLLSAELQRQAEGLVNLNDAVNALASRLDSVAFSGLNEPSVDEAKAGGPYAVSLAMQNADAIEALVQKVEDLRARVQL